MSTIGIIEHKVKNYADQLKELKPKPPKATEGQIVNACIRTLFALGYFVWRNNSGAWKPEGSNRPIRYGLTGSADIIGLTPKGRFLAVECKTGKNGQTDHQKRFQAHIEEKGGLYILAYSVDDLMAGLQS